MKNTLMTVLMIFFMIQVSYAENNVQVNVTGEIKATGCSITTPTQTIDLGTWQVPSSSGIGSGINSRTPYVEYNFDFYCPPGLAIHAQLEGNQDDSSNPYNIGIDKGFNSATGVVIVMHRFSTETNAWVSIIYGEDRALIFSTQEGDNIVKFRAAYKQVSEYIKSGMANATVTLAITYE